jgi:hypothetical protein
MVKTSWGVVFRLIALVIVLSQQTIAQVTSSCPETVSSLRDVSVQLTLMNGQTVSRQGEVVELKVRYSSRSPGKYTLSINRIDRSGRIDRGGRRDGVDLLCLQPDIGTDPLDDYFHSLPARYMLAGAVPYRQIGAGPITTDLELNEWWSLPPGQYRLSIQSKRVNLEEGGAPVPVQSNWITFQIVNAEPAWQSSAFTGAISTLDSPTATSAEKEHAAKALRFLGSEDASRELVRRFWRSSPQNLGWKDFKFGLYGTPFRRTAIQEMKAILQSSRDATKDWFIDVMVNLELLSDPRFRKLRYGTQLADSEGNPGSSYEEEYERRVSAYTSTCILCPKVHKDDAIHLPEPPWPSWPPTR